MKKYLILNAAGTLMALASTTSFAADMASPELPPDTPIDAGTYDWNGAYIGISGGYIKPDGNISFLGNSSNFGNGSYLIGGTIGYNYQMENFVFGLEGDLSYAHDKGRFDDIFGFGFDGHADSTYFGTVRGRVGYAFDRVLVFGTGGIAFTGLKLDTAAGRSTRT